MDDIKELSDGEIKIKLVLAITNNKSFYYKMIRCSDETEIGNCGIRLENNLDNYYLGNIEYEVFEEYRGNSYASKASKLLGQVALYFGVTELSITARPDNLASIKTIEKLGANFICVEKVPKKHRLYKTSKQVAIYKINLESERVK